MKQNDIDIYEILNRMPSDTKFYSPMCGEARVYVLAGKSDFDAITMRSASENEFYLSWNGKFDEGGDLMLFPSKEMRDWSKVFFKGNVVSYKNGDLCATCVFDSWGSSDFTEFKARYLMDSEANVLENVVHRDTKAFSRVDEKDAEEFIAVLEEHFGGKLNRETLEIEKPLKLELGKLYTFTEDDEDGELTIIGKLIRYNWNEDTATFGNQYEIENDKYVTDQAFDLRISAHKELREATQEEYQKFNNAHGDWKHEQEKSKFKLFDKVLVRDKDTEDWMPAFFIKMNETSDMKAFPYQVFLLQEGSRDMVSHCIPYEGNEKIAFTTYDIENLPF